MLCVIMTHIRSRAVVPILQRYKRVPKKLYFVELFYINLIHYYIYIHSTSGLISLRYLSSADTSLVSNSQDFSMLL